MREAGDTGEQRAVRLLREAVRPAASKKASGDRMIGWRNTVIRAETVYLVRESAEVNPLMRPRRQCIMLPVLIALVVLFALALLQ